MPDESYPIGLGDQTLFLRFEDRDVAEIERSLSLFVAFHPAARTYENAALLIWRGLRKRAETGDLVYAIPQDSTGKPIALKWVKSFCCQFSDVMGMVILYGYISKALIVAGYFGEEKEREETKPATMQDGDRPKNLPRPTGKGGRGQRMGSAGSALQSSGG